MNLRMAAFTALFFAALALAPAVAHLCELPNKIGLPAHAYLTVQRIYRGWALFSFVVFGALASSLWLALVTRPRRRARLFAAIAFAAIAGTQAVFWTWTYPANAATGQWTFLPEGWHSLRLQWEYSHAASAVLNLIAFVCLLLSLLQFLPIRHERPA
jgi:hypothetical protein